MGNILYQEDLDELVQKGCDTPGCTEPVHNTLYLGHSKPGVEVRVFYSYVDGTLTIECEECPIMTVAIAPRPETQ